MQMYPRKSVGIVPEVIPGRSFFRTGLRKTQALPTASRSAWLMHFHFPSGLQRPMSRSISVSMPFFSRLALSFLPSPAPIGVRQ